MGRYILQRVVMMVPTLFIISVVVFVLIQLPPGDIVSSSVARFQQQGLEASAEQIAALRAQYNLDQPFVMQYLTLDCDIQVTNYEQ